MRSPVSIGGLMTLLIFCTALPLLILTFFMYQSMATSADRATRDNMLANVRTLALLIESEIDTHVAVATTLATDDALRRGDLTTFQARAQVALQKTSAAWLKLVKPDGTLQLSTLGEQQTAQRLEMPARPNTEYFLTDVTEGPVSHRKTVFLVYPVVYDGEHRWSIVIGLDPSRFLGLMQGKFGNAPAIGLLDTQHQFIARIPDHDRRVGTLASESWRAAIAQASEGVLPTVTVEDTPSLTAYKTTRGGWIVGLSFPTAVVNAPARNVMLTLAPLMLTALLLSLFLGWGLSRHVTSALTALAATARTIGQGEVVETRVFPIIEATDISTALASASQDLSARTQALGSAHRTFFNLIQNAPFGVYLVDSSFRIAQISLGAQRVFETVQPVVGRDFAEVMKTLWHEPFASDFVSRFRHTLTTGEPYHPGEYRGPRRDTSQPEAYDWQIERVTLPSGEYGVVCYFYDLTAQMKAELALKESEARFRSTFENAAVGVARVGLDGRWLEVNRRLCEIVGWSKEELLEKSAQEITHPDDKAATEDSLRRLLAGAVESFTLDKRYLNGSNDPVWVALTTAVRRDESGEPLYFISIIRDIADRKQAQEQQMLLLRELAHRLRNQLAILQSMAAQTARNARSVDEFQQQFSQRVFGLAVATHILLDEQWSGARLDLLVRRQLEPFIPMAHRLTISGPHVIMSPQASQAIGLALHELATNAVKYGAWSSAEGLVSVEWTLLRNGGQLPQLQLDWRESGGPAVQPPTRKGFGHVVVEHMAAQSVEGRATLEFLPNGLHWTLEISSEHVKSGAPADTSPQADGSFDRA